MEPLGDIFDVRSFEARILRVFADVALVFGRAAETQIGAAGIGAVGGARRRRKSVPAIREGEAIAECAIRAQAK